MTSSIPINGNVPMTQNIPIGAPFFSSNGLFMNPTSPFLTQTQVQSSPQPFQNFMNIPNNEMPQLAVVNNPYPTNIPYVSSNPNPTIFSPFLSPMNPYTQAFISSPSPSQLQSYYSIAQSIPQTLPQYILQQPITQPTSNSIPLLQYQNLPSTSYMDYLQNPQYNPYVVNLQGGTPNIFVNSNIPNMPYTSNIPTISSPVVILPTDQGMNLIANSNNSPILPIPNYIAIFKSSNNNKIQNLSNAVNKKTSNTTNNSIIKGNSPTNSNKNNGNNTINNTSIKTTTNPSTVST